MPLLSGKTLADVESIVQCIDPKVFPVQCDVRGEKTVTATNPSMLERALVRLSDIHGPDTDVIISWSHPG